MSGEPLVTGNSSTGPRANRVQRMGSLTALVFIVGCGNPNKNTTDEMSSHEQVRPKDSASVAASGKIKLGLVQIHGKWTRMAYEDHGNFATILGDSARIPMGSYRELKAGDSEAMGLIAQGSTNAIATDYLWPGMRVPYNLRSDLPQRVKENFETAVGFYHLSTPIRFVPATPSDQEVLEVVVSNEDYSCGWAYQGRQKNFPPRYDDNGMLMKDKDGKVLEDRTYPKNPLVLSDRADCLNDPRTIGLIQHELAHAIGLGHEFSRSDRDNYIKIGNFRPPAEGSTVNDVFPKLSGYVFGSFDYNSITMYGPYIFSIAERKHLPVVTDKAGQTNFAGNITLSAGDMRGIAHLYKSQGAPVLAAPIEDQVLSVNSRKELRLKLENVPDCSHIEVALSDPSSGVRASVTQVEGLPDQCVLTLESGAQSGYTDVSLKIFKVMVNLRSRDNFTRIVRTQRVGDVNQPFSIEKFRVRSGNPTGAPTAIITNIVGPAENAMYIGDPKFPAQRRVLEFETLSSVPGDEFSYTLSGPDADKFIVVKNILMSAYDLDKDFYQLQVTSKNLAGQVFSKQFEFFTRLPQQRNIVVTGRLGFRAYRIDSNNNICVNPPVDSKSSVWIDADKFMNLHTNIKLSIAHDGSLYRLVENQSSRTKECIAPVPTSTPTSAPTSGPVVRATPRPTATPSPVMVLSPEMIVCPNFLSLSSPINGLVFFGRNSVIPQTKRTAIISGVAKDVLSCTLDFAGGEFTADPSCKVYRNGRCREWYTCAPTIKLSVSASQQDHEKWNFPVVGEAVRVNGCRYKVEPLSVTVNTSASRTKAGIKFNYENCTKVSDFGANCTLVNPGVNYTCSEKSNYGDLKEMSCVRK